MERCFDPPAAHLGASLEREEIDLLIEKYFSWMQGDGSSSVHSGQGGLTLLCYCLSVLDPARANLWRERVVETGKSLGSKKRLSSPSFVEGRSGVACMIGLAFPARQGAVCEELCAEARSACQDSSDLPDELWYGRAGLLSALLFAEEHFAVAGSKLHEHQLMLYDRIVSSKTWKWHGKRYIGLVHGAAGILLVLMRTRRRFSEEEQKLRPVAVLLERAQKLRKFQFESGNFQSNPKNTSDRLVQLCHGAPGVAVLLFELGEMDIALKCCECVWSRGCLTKGVGLCHGIGG